MDTAKVQIVVYRNCMNHLYVSCCRDDRGEIPYRFEKLLSEADGLLRTPRLRYVVSAQFSASTTPSEAIAYVLACLAQTLREQEEYAEFWASNGSDTDLLPVLGQAIESHSRLAAR